MASITNKRTWIGAGTILLLLIFQQLASKIGGAVANLFKYNSVDQYGIFAWISVHHIVQMCFALLVVVILSKIYKLDFGFRLGKKNIGFKYVAVFSIVIFIYALISYIIAYSCNHILQYTYPKNIKNILGSLGFQLLLSGPSEEILFRAVPITIIIFGFGRSKDLKLGKWNLPFEIIIAALFFSMAHISWTIHPFSINVNYFQVTYAFILGTIYGKSYQKSGSVLYPMIMHSVSNVFMVGLGYIFAVI